MKRIIVTLLLSPFITMAMEESSSHDALKDMYIGIVAQQLNYLKSNDRINIYPAASTTMIYKYLSKDAKPEYVASIDDMNPLNSSLKVIETPMDQKSVRTVLQTPSFIYEKDDNKVISLTAIISYIFSSNKNKSSYNIPLGSAFIDTDKNKEWMEHINGKEQEVKPAYIFEQQFLPGHTFTSGISGSREYREPQPDLATNPDNKTALILAFLKMEQAINEKNERTYKPCVIQTLE